MKFADFSRLLLVVIVFNYAYPEAIGDDGVASSAATSSSSPKGAFTALSSTSAQITSPSTTIATTTTTPTTTLASTTTPTTTPTTAPTTTTPTLPPTTPSTTKTPTTTSTTTTTTTTTTTPSPTTPPTTSTVATSSTPALATSTAKSTTIKEQEADPTDKRKMINEEKVTRLERENERLKIAVGILAAIIIVTVLFVLLIIYLRKRNNVEMRTSEKPNRPIYFRPVSNFKKTPPIDQALEYLHDDRLFVNDLDKEMETFRLNRGTNQMTSEL